VLPCLESMHKSYQCRKKQCRPRVKEQWQ
jgi:hypothetical protein